MGKLYLLLCLLVILLLTACKKHDLQSPEPPISPDTKAVDSNPKSLGLLQADLQVYQKHIRVAGSESARTMLCPSVDLTPKFPLPGQQGLQGSCVSWVVAYMKTYWEGIENSWDLQEQSHITSPHYIFSQTHTSEEAGGGASYLYDALELLVQQGAATLDICPYEPWNYYGFQNEPTDAMRQQAFRFRNAGWSALPMQDVNAIKGWLCNGSPVALGIPVFPDFDNLNYLNDTYNTFSGDLRGWHAVVLTGYDDVKQAFKFINSWSQGWGVEGYGWISYDLIANYSLEAYIMQDQPNPPIAETWSSASGTGIGHHGYYSGDVNGDGNSDVIQPVNDNGMLAIMAHDITGTSATMFINQTLPGTPFSTAGFVAGDVDGDGKTDLVRGWNNANKLALTIFNSTGTAFTRTWDGNTTAPYQSIRLLPVDYDGDGKSDIAQLYNQYNSLGINLFKSDGSSYTLTSGKVMPIGAGNIGFIPADYNGDGRTDIIQFWNNNGMLGVVIFRSTGTAYDLAWIGTMADSATNVGFAPVDYNGDGNTDFVRAWKDANNNLSLSLYTSDGNTFSFHSKIATRSSYESLGLLPERRAGEPKAGFMMVYNSNARTAFARFEPIQY
jgi:hypothetical protein